jgi:hypothetical protein
MYNKIKLYHFSNSDFKNKISVNFYGQNYFTSNDFKITEVKRAFYYLEPRELEHRFIGCRYLYITEILKSRVYDLRADLRGYKLRYNTITRLLRAIKQNYNGVIYEAGGVVIVNLFYDVKIKDKVTLTKY